MPRLALALLLALAVPPAAVADTTVRRGTEAPLAGDGHKVTQPRSPGAFTAIRLEGALDVDVQVGAPAAVAVTIDENLQPRVETRLDGDTLVINSGSMRYRGDAKVSVATPALRAFELEGSGRVTIREGAGDTTLSLAGSGDLDWKGKAGALGVELDGSGTVRLAGRAQALRVELNGSGDVKADGLAAVDAAVEINGSGDVDLTLDGGALSAEISGSGDVRWAGTARSERSAVSGSGRVTHR